MGTPQRRTSAMISMLPTWMEREMRLLVMCIGFIVALAGCIATVLICATASTPLLAQCGLLGLLPALIISLIALGGSGALIHSLDHALYEPLRWSLGAFLWGAVVAFPLAFFLERASDHVLLYPSTIFLSLIQSLGVGIIEEAVKAMGLLLLFLLLRDELETLAHGILYGVLIGTGFTVVENFCFFATNTSSLPFLIVGRVLLGGLNHACFTACVGGALGYMGQVQRGWKRRALPLLGYGVAVGLHSLFDFVTMLVSLLLTQPMASDDRIAGLAALALMSNYVPPFLVQYLLGRVLFNARNTGSVLRKPDPEQKALSVSRCTRRGQNVIWLPGKAPTQTPRRHVFDVQCASRSTSSECCWKVEDATHAQTKQSQALLIHASHPP